MVLQKSRSTASLATGEAGESSSVGKSFDTSSFCRLAQQIPEPKATGNPTYDTDAKSGWRAFVRTVDYLWNHPEDRLRTWAYLETPPTTNTNTTEKGWDMSVAYVSRLPKYWKAQWLVQQSGTGKGAFTQEVCDRIDARDPGAIDKLFRLFTETRPSSKVPVLCRKSGEVCAKTFARRALQVNSKIKTFAGKYVKPNGDIDWAKGGAYALEWEGAVAKRIVYHNGDQAVLTNEVTKSFMIKDAWDPFAARADGPGAAKYVLAEYFDGKSGPHKNAITKKNDALEQIAKDVQAEVDKLQDAVKADTIDNCEDFIGKAAQELRKQKLQEAQQKAADNSKRRRLLRIASQ